MQLNVRVYPKASRNAVKRSDDGSLKVWVTAAPVDGRANEAVVNLLADRLDISKSSVRILRGHRTRTKIVQFEGLKSADIPRLVGSAG